MRAGRPAVAAGLPGVLCVPAHAEARDIGRADRAVARGAGAGRIP
ncbi:hypothetical protein [Streptomyces sp. SID5643]|nr:hypothetical protein [Streptomyces sp. SID5643]